jgi:photosystem II stability/assembly factor-like uncharacterized protein
MKKTLSVLIALMVLCLSCERNPQIPIKHKKSGAAKAMEEWAMARSYPEGRIKMSKLAKAYDAQKQRLETRNNAAEWESLGPKNIGGRTLCVAFHPTNPDIQYIGSASGGLWKTTSAGIGVNAWERIDLGHPVLGVSSIVINPQNPEEMYIGTGEVYNYTVSMPGIANRLTRGSYGMGILKTTDGGQNWEKTLDWSYTDLRGVWDLVINPVNTNTVLAATTEGIYRTQDAGSTWSLVHDFPMGIDLEMHPQDTNKIFASHGGYLSPQAGIFVSENGGSSFTLIDELPNDYTGKSLISISESNPDIIYISMAEALEGRGLFRSTDGGLSWEVVNLANIPTYQGWFAHDVAIKPDDPEHILWAGVETYKSVDGGFLFTKKTVWSAWYFGQVPVGGPEGPPEYAHADIHAIYYAPFDNNTVYLATDGGIFVSQDNGESWEGRNGGYQTQQFYSRFSSSASDSLLAMGGLQDNATAIYTGEDAWVRVIGGDGMCTAIHPIIPSRLYGSAQNLNMRRSDSGGDGFYNVTPPGVSSELRNFNGPFIMSPQNPEVMYAGAQRLHKTEDGGYNWQETSVDLVDQQFGNPILTIGLSEADPLKIMVGTSALAGGAPGLFLSNDGGLSWNKMQGLPDRIPMEVVFHPGSADTAYVVFSGFDTHHLYRTEDGGNSWSPLGSGLPDIPANSVIVDPLLPTDIYVATDLGVYNSFDGGQTFELYSGGIAGAVMSMHLSISPTNRKLRLATHGMGVYQTDLRDPDSTISSTGEAAVAVGDKIVLKNYPNPVISQSTFEFTLPQAASIQIELYDLSMRRVQVLETGNFPAGTHEFSASLKDLPAGSYYYAVRGNWDHNGQAFRHTEKLLKQ